MMSHKNSKMHRTCLRELKRFQPILCNKGQFQGLDPPSRLQAKFKGTVHGASWEADGCSACQKKMPAFYGTWSSNITFTVINVYQMEWFHVLSGVRVRQGQKIFLFYTVQTGIGALPASYSVGIEDLSRELRWPGREAGRSPPSSAEVKNEWSYSHPYAFKA